MKLLITGGAGYVGSVCAAVLVEQGHDVTIIDNFSTGNREAVPETARVVEGDVADKAADVLGEGGFEGVIHFAARSLVGESVEKPDEYWQHNVGEGLNPLLRDALATGFALRRVVISNCPRRALEQANLGVVPAGVLGTGHRVPAHVTAFHATLQEELADLRLDRNHVGNAAARRMLFDLIQHRVHRIHGGSDDDKGVVSLGACEDRRHVIGDVIARFDGAAGAGSRVIIAIHCVFACHEVAQQGTTNEAEADDAYGSLNVLRTHGDNSGTTRLISRGMSDDNISFAVTVARNEGQWVVREFDDDFEDINTSINAVRALRSEGAAFALLCVDDDYFVVVRPVPGDVRMLISDATYADEDDFAALGDVSQLGVLLGEQSHRVKSTTIFSSLMLTWQRQLVPASTARSILSALQSSTRAFP